MTRHHTSFRLSTPAVRKLAELAKVYGNKTTAIEMAIHHLYTHEKEQRDEQLHRP